MAQQFYLADEAGTKVYDLNDNGIRLLDPYYPPVAEDGAETEPLTDDQAQLSVDAASGADLQAKIAELNRWLRYGERHPAGETGLWLHYSPDASATHRSRVVGGRAITSERLLPDLKKKKGTLKAVIKRLGYWEGAREQLALTNPNGAATTDWLALYNCDDGAAGTGALGGTRHNHFSIAGDDVLGDLPAGCHLELAFSGLQHIYLGVGSVYDQSLALSIEGESALLAEGVDDTTCSGGAYLAGALGTYNYVFDCAPSRGQWYWPVLRVNPHALGGSITLSVGSQAVTSTPAYTLGGYQLVALPVVAIPPVVLPGATGGIMGLFVTFSVATDFDHLTLLPVDSWASVDMAAALPYPENLYLDSILDYSYFEHGSALETGRTGPGLLLEPGADQTVWLLGQSDLGSDTPNSLPDRPISAKLWYRPRYRTL